MKKDHFSAEELQYLEDLRILGGSDTLLGQHSGCANLICVNAACPNGMCAQGSCEGTYPCANDPCGLRPPYPSQCICSPYMDCV